MPTIRITTSRIPQTIPALKIPPTISQLCKANKQEIRNAYRNDRFIRSFLLPRYLQVLFHGFCVLNPDPDLTKKRLLGIKFYGRGYDYRFNKASAITAAALQHMQSCAAEKGFPWLPN
jgi:hypothetical protein